MLFLHNFKESKFFKDFQRCHAPRVGRQSVFGTLSLGRALLLLSGVKTQTNLAALTVFQAVRRKCVKLTKCSSSNYLLELDFGAGCY